ncbi:MAG: hypothetical protein JWR16_1932, partial [Nevskia sp.]|nr:hypothetical protein [Nevskia sp.]MDB5986879.1 hypothetical protein [Nevskia sp.]
MGGSRRVLAVCGVLGAVAPYADGPVSLGDAG